MFFDDVIKSPRVDMQEGGPLLPMMDPQGNLPPEVIAGDVVNGAPMGMVDVPSGGGPVDDGVPTELPEGTFVLNAAAIQYHGTETIDKLINDAVRSLLKEGVQISAEDPNPNDDVPVAISNGEYVIPPEVAEKIGYKKLEDMNERGLEYRKKQEEAEKKQAEAQPPAQPPQQPQETFMGLQMPPEQAGPPQAPVQSEQQAMAMMGMANGGPVANGLGTAIKAVTEFVNAQQPMLQQGGFVENYTYAQPQQTTLGTPFPNAATSNPQQYGSFVQPNKQRVNAANGTEIYAGAEEEVGFDVSAMTVPFSVKVGIRNKLVEKLNSLKENDPKAKVLQEELEGLSKNIVPTRLYNEYKEFLVPYTPGTELLPSGKPVTPEMENELKQYKEKQKKRKEPRPKERSAANGGFIN